MMKGSPTEPERRCPQCRAPVDPLRAGAVSIVGGTIVHYCSAVCREAHLARALAPEAPAVSVPEEAPRPEVHEGGGEERRGEARAAGSVPGSSRAGFGVPAVALHIVAPHAIEIALLCGCAAAIMLVPPGALDGFLAAAISGGAILLSAAVAMFRERRSSASRFAEVASLTMACGALAVACAIDRAGRAPALVALAVLAADRAGRLLEIAGRRRSGVLEVVSGNGPSLLASEWRDNSSLAARIRTVATIVEWARIPLALGAGAAVWFSGREAPTLGLYAGATVMLALSPRALRMVTGDAHLSVALRAARAGVVIRDAHTVHQVASARIVMFMTRRALVAPEVGIVDWQVAEGADEGTVKDALAALEAGAQGRFAAALRGFLGDRPGAGTATGVEEHPGRGLAGDTRHGRVVCGTRTLLMELGISAAMHEAWARGGERSGRRVFFVAVDGVVRATMGAQEEPAQGVQEVTRRLALLGLDPAMTTSAEADAAIALGARLGIENVRFEDRRPEVAWEGIFPWAELSGTFSFSYTRGRPAQPFP